LLAGLVRTLSIIVPGGRPTSTSSAVLSVDDSGSRQLRKVLLLGGEPFSGPILMW
jgi:hypothetical protein